MNKSQILSARIETLIEDLAARVSSTKALYMRPGTPGERDAAKSALDRMRAKHGDVHGLGKDHDHMMSHHMPNHGVTPNQHSPGKSHSSSSTATYKPQRQAQAGHGFYAKNDHKYTGPFGSREGAEEFAHYKNHFKPHVVHHDGGTGKWTETSSTSQGTSTTVAGRTSKKHKLDPNAEFYHRHPADD